MKTSTLQTRCLVLFTRLLGNYMVTIFTLLICILWNTQFHLFDFGGHFGLTFENLNGYIGTMFHGTRRIIYQMSFNIQLLQTLPKKLIELSRAESIPTQDLIKRLFNQRKSNMQQIDDHCYVVGKIKLHHFTADELHTISSSGIDLTGCPVAQCFERLMVSNVVYYGSIRSRSSSRDNSMCTYLARDGSVSVGIIMSFYAVKKHTSPFCLLQTYIITGDSPINSIRPCRNKTIRQLNKHSLLRLQLIQAEPNPGQLIALTIKSILKKCVHIKFSGQGSKIYCIPQPNPYEVH